MKFEQLTKGTSVWYNFDETKEQFVIATYESEEGKFIVISGEDDCPWNYDHFKDNYSFTQEEALKRHGEKKQMENQLIKEIYEIEELLSSKVQALKDDYDNWYTTKNDILTESACEEFRKNIREICLMINVSAECFDYHTRTFSAKSKIDKRRETLNSAGIYEK